MIEKSQIVRILQKFGFGEKEARVYLTLLELKEAISSTISRKTGLKRPTTYLMLENLQKQGLVSHVKKGNSLYFRATKPDFFLEKEEKHLNDLKGDLNSLKSSLPELLAMHDKYSATPPNVRLPRHGRPDRNYGRHSNHQHRTPLLVRRRTRRKFSKRLLPHLHQKESRQKDLAEGDIPIQ